MDQDLTANNIIDALSSLIAHQMKVVERAARQKAEEEERSTDSEYDFTETIRVGAANVAELRRLRVELEDLRVRLVRG